jgi:hypothetical protein
VLDDWNRLFPNCEPVAHHLPLALPERWVRFHSLPGQKRYPENEAEYSMVLERHNRIMGQLARIEEKIALLTTGWSETEEPIRSQPELWKLDPHTLPWRTIAMHKQPDNLPEPTFWHVFLSYFRWSPGVFDPLVRLVADDVVGNLMIVALDCRWLLHPYDGGMDVVMESHAAKETLKEQNLDWLAPECMTQHQTYESGL